MYVFPILTVKCFSVFLIAFLLSFNLYVTVVLTLKVILLPGLATSVHCFLLLVPCLNFSKSFPVLSSFSVFAFHGGFGSS